MLIRTNSFLAEIELFFFCLESADIEFERLSLTICKLLELRNQAFFVIFLPLSSLFYFNNFALLWILRIKIDRKMETN